MRKAFANILPAGPVVAQSSPAIELVCPVDTLVQLRAAVDNGADWIQLRLPSLERRICGDSHLNVDAMASGIRYAHDRRCKVAILPDRQPESFSWSCQRELIDQAAAYRIDAIELSEHALMLYAAAHYPQLQLHYVAGSSTDALSSELLKRQLNVSRMALPDLLSMAELIRISRETTVELQLYGFCRFSSVVDADKLQAAAIEKRLKNAEPVTPGTDTLADQCATAQSAANDTCFSDRSAGEIKVLRLLPQLNALGIRAIRIDAAASRPTHTAHITRVWREAIDECMENADRYVVRPSWIAELNNAARNLHKY